MENRSTENYDIKRALKHLYAPKADAFVEVDVPEQAYLMVDGYGDPNTSTAYAEAIELLYGLSYGCRFTAKDLLGRVHTVGPLEALWWAEDPADFVARRKEAWSWTAMIAQPEWITQQIVDEALLRKPIAASDRIRLATLTEGRSVQILHVGSYDDEGPTLARLHDEYMPSNGLTFSGHHHEIYLSDARRVEPAKLRTVLRQPVRSLADSGA